MVMCNLMSTYCIKSHCTAFSIDGEWDCSRNSLFWALSQTGVVGYDRRSSTFITSNLMTIKFTGGHFPSEIILQSVRYYLSYKLSYREIEEILAERSINVDHSTLNRWVLKYAPLLELRARRRKKSVASSWRMDETYINVKGQWKYYYRAVDKYGDVIDFYCVISGMKKPREPFSKRPSANMDFLKMW